jgi:hypothetical protein
MTAAAPSANTPRKRPERRLLTAAFYRWGLSLDRRSGQGGGVSRSELAFAQKLRIPAQLLARVRSVLDGERTAPVTHGTVEGPPALLGK